MDMTTLGAAVALAKKVVLPTAEAADVGKVLTVGDDGKWTAGAPISATITVSGSTLVITGEGE